MRNAITQSNVLQIHLKRPANGRLAVRVCAEPAHARTRAGGKALARFARSGAPDSLQKPTTRTQPTQPGKTCPRSLRSLGCSRFPPMPHHKQPTNTTKQDVPSLATLARVLPIPSAPPPDTRSLRSLVATPRPLHSACIVRATPCGDALTKQATFRARSVSSGCRPLFSRLHIAYLLPPCECAPRLRAAVRARRFRPTPSTPAPSLLA